MEIVGIRKVPMGRGSLAWEVTETMVNQPKTLTEMHKTIENVSLRCSLIALHVYLRCLMLRAGPRQLLPNLGLRRSKGRRYSQSELHIARERGRGEKLNGS